MDPYLTEWLNLLLRFLHVITGIAWIGASFYFIWLDNHLEKPPQWKIDQGIKGDLWAIHGGGFYEVAKYQLAPRTMPSTLHWFKWEAYTTWITGFFLLALMYYVGAEVYLIDKRIADLTQWQAIGVGLTVIIGGWFCYDLLCNSKLAKQGGILGIVLLTLATALAYFLTHTFSARGAYIHMGAVIGTIMVGNVFRIIIPSQQALVTAVKTGKMPDPQWGAKAKLRSTHNTYTTLPLVFIMISNHYPITYSHAYNWAILIAIIVITAISRQYFVLRHKGIHKPGILIGAGIATVVLAISMAPFALFTSKPTSPAQAHTTMVEKHHQPAIVDVVQIEQVLKNRCASCHSIKPTDNTFRIAPGGVLLDDILAMQQWAPRIKARVIDATDMPFMNKTGMTQPERELIARWIAQGAPAS
ncbi:urate hydroxylase PuuD [Endozoicomonas sp. SM1973]|uniref:Urate hydroxylase PuuD n=1 Tax=Spartinivicinus marinus TaxID=2994442 RepID=A0A853I575_9GAMM|nr:urate hydroxylase PuuD [Spartinivicinus marinus]MCX4029517.1 urate hydroxylase PuuD [Spartinivicinus marinus]NYZ65091.1 urate hydroxylase PuuD [Spartinivicinus marinus]